MRTSRHRHPLLAAIALTVCISASSTDHAKADAGGVGFWLPGSMGSLSAVPGQAGWSFTTVYLHLEANAGAGKELQNNASIVTGLHARADAVGFLPAYTFETPVLGGQLTIGAAGVPDIIEMAFRDAARAAYVIAGPSKAFHVITGGLPAMLAAVTAAERSQLEKRASASAGSLIRM
jgi:hypothetical protein